MMKQFGHYQVIAELGRGGMGVVLKAHEQSLNRYVAIKVLSQQLADDPQVKERFIREARAVAALNHPNVVQVYFAGEHEGQPFFSMEFVQGQSLSEYLKQQAPLSPREAAEILLQAAKGLAAAHAKGIVHRDIKPANLMMTEDGTIKLTDFGIAMAEDQGQKLTSTGEFVGTPGYLSPEVCIGAEVDARTDIFSLGIVYFEMLAGAPPFTNPSPLGLMREVVEAQIPDITSLNQEVDATTRELLTTMLQKKPEDRFASCEPIIEALENGLKQGLFSDKRPLPNRDATRIWSEETTDATRKGATAPPTAPSGPAAAPPPAPAAQPSPQPAAQTAASATAATAVSAGAAQGRSTGLWLAVALLVVFAGASVAAVRFFPGLLPQPLQTLVAAMGWAGDTDKQSLAGERAEPQSRPKAVDNIPVEIGQDTMAAEAMTDPSPAGTGLAQEPELEKSQRISPMPLTSESSTAPELAGQQTFTQPVAAKTAPAARPVPRPKAVDVLAQARKASLKRLASGQARAVVLLAGEPAVLDALQEPLTTLLEESGIELVDSGMVDGAGPWLRNDHWDLKGLRKKALLEGVDIVVLVSSRYLGQETLNYYGQSSELISSNVAIKVLRVPDLKLILPGKRFQVRYTSLNRDYQVREAFADVADELEHRLRSAMKRS